MESFTYKDYSNNGYASKTYPHKHDSIADLKKQIEEYRNLCEDLMLLIDMFSTNNVDLILFQRIRDQYSRTMSRK